VLIPRPETELLVERALDSAARLELGGAELTLADVGTGSGVVAVSLAVRLPHAMVYATDVSADALEVAVRNAERHGVDHRIRFLQGNLLDPLPGSVHGIVANLPYISTGYLSTLASDVLDYEPRLALHGGEDGLQLVQGLLAQTECRLLPGGFIWLEIGAFQGQKAVALARQHFPNAQIELLQDYARLDRNVHIQV
jgi:release factor glutamine methyltransferase